MLNEPLDPRDKHCKTLALQGAISANPRMTTLKLLNLIRHWRENRVW
jgi:hypothetical protein